MESIPLRSDNRSLLKTSSFRSCRYSSVPVSNQGNSQVCSVIRDMIPLSYTLSSTTSPVKMFIEEGLLNPQRRGGLLLLPREWPFQALRPTLPQCARDLLRTTPWSGLTSQHHLNDVYAAAVEN